jgi:RNA polymerase sigma factor for flagellar operon FliA
MIAWQMRGVYMNFSELDDMVNEGIIALMSIIEKFNPQLNIKFETYASVRIRGCIIDFVRKNGYVVRGQLKAIKDIDNAVNDLRVKLCREATDEEVAEYLGIGMNEYLKMLKKSQFQNVLSLDAMFDDVGESAPTMRIQDDSDENLLEVITLNSERKVIISEAIKKLRQNEQLTLSLYYRKNLSMREIAEVLGVTEPRISQIHSNAIRKLRLALNDYING